MARNLVCVVNAAPLRYQGGTIAFNSVILLRELEGGVTMFSAMRLDYAVCIKPRALACGVKTNGPILGAGVLALMLFSGSAAQAQCVGGGALASPNGLDKTVAMAVAGVSSSV